MENEERGLLGIRAVAKLVGLAPSALCFYDDVGLLAPAQVDRATGYRLYGYEQAGRAVLTDVLGPSGPTNSCPPARRLGRSAPGATVSLPMVELKSGVPVNGLLQQMPQLRHQISNTQTAIDAADGQRYFLTGVETLESVFSHNFDGYDWYDRLYSPGYWAVRDMTPTTTRPMPLLRSASDRILRWLDDVDTELTRIRDQDEWDDKNIPRLVLDTSAIVREGEFDSFDWGSIVNNVCVRIIIPILVIRELDNLKNYGKEPKARRRLRRIYELLDGEGRGPARIRNGVTIELLMNPPRHVPFAINDEEIIRRSLYLKGRLGGPVKLVSGDYRLVLSAQSEGLDAQLTPAELKEPTK